MALTTTQLAALKLAINNDPVLSAIPNSTDGAYAVADELKKYPTVDFLVWMTNAPTQNIIDAIDGDKYTPVDVVPVAVIPDTPTEGEKFKLKQYEARILACQTKQISLQTLVIGRETINASKVNVRKWLQDAVIKCPAGAAGALVHPGGASGATTLTACLRKASRGEQILAAGFATTGTVTGNLLGFEGTLSNQDVEAARNSV